MCVLNVRTHKTAIKILYICVAYSSTPYYNRFICSYMYETLCVQKMHTHTHIKYAYKKYGCLFCV